MNIKRKWVCTIVFASLAIFNVAESQTVSEALQVEQAIRDYYQHLKAYDYAAMRSMTTAEFEITYSGVQLDKAAFEERHREEEQVRGPAESRPERFLYELSNFRTELAGGLAYVTCLESNPGGGQYFNLLVLRRSSSGQWLVHRFFHMRDETSISP